MEVRETCKSSKKSIRGEWEKEQKKLGWDEWQGQGERKGVGRNEFQVESETKGGWDGKRIEKQCKV